MIVVIDLAYTITLTLTATRILSRSLTITLTRTLRLCALADVFHSSHVTHACNERT